MAEYIDREKIVSIIKEDIKQCKEDAENAFGDEAYLQAVNSRENGLHFILLEVERQPVEDVQKVVRCKDCRNCRPYNGLYYCFKPSQYVRVKPTDYCSYGERKCNNA